MLNLDCIAYQACGPEHSDYNKIWLTWIPSQWGEPTRLLDDLTTAVESYTELKCMVSPIILRVLGPWCDFFSFVRVGFAAVDFESPGCPSKDFIHTPMDSVDQLHWIDYDNGTHVTRSVVACLATLAMLAPARIYPDFDGDGDVDIEDCVLLIEHWRGSDSQFDIAPPPSGDGIVNDQDLSALLYYWFSDRSSWFDFPEAQYSGGTGEPNDPYQIATAEDLMLLGVSPYDYDKHFIMTADIDLDPNLPGRKVFDGAVIAPEAISAFLPVLFQFKGRPFTGVFDGNGHTISHMTITGKGYPVKHYLALFGQLEHGAEVFNLGLKAVDVNGMGDYIGGLVGHSRGESVKITNCYSTGAVTGSGWYFRYIGGLVGCNRLSSSITTSYSTCTVNGSDYVGGLVGFNSGNIDTSYGTGTVSGDSYVGGLVGSNEGSITNSYSTGMVTGNEDFGGLVGSNNYGGNISSSFWDMETSGQTTSDGGNGKTTAEMQTAGTFLDAGWNFVDEIENGTEDIWWIDEGKDYPRLLWEAAEQ
jgi:hypothetical protein